MEKKKKGIIIIFLLILTTFSFNIPITKADIIKGVYLVTNEDMYSFYGFDLKDPPIYNAHSLVSLDLPLIILLNAPIDIKKSDLDKRLANINQNFTDRLLNFEIQVLGKIDNTKFAINFHADLKADNTSFNIDLIPKVKINNDWQEFTKFAWWNSNWDYKKKITIDHDQVSGGSDLINFPILIHRGTDSDLSSHAQADGDDIVFIDSSETTQYNHEIENYTSATGNLYAWVNITTLKYDTDTELYMYYGNALCNNQQNVPDTWNSEYVYVFHMNDSTTSSITDSTINGNVGTKTGANNPYEHLLMVDSGQQFEESDSSKIVCSQDSGVLSALTLEAWAKLETEGHNHCIMVDQYDTASNNEMSYQYRINNADQLYIKCFSASGGIGTGATSAGDRFTTGTFYYVVGTWNNGANAYATYIDGSLDATGTGSGTMNDHVNRELVLGAEKDAGSYKLYADADFDEMRISNTVRSVDWLITTYNTIKNSTTFVTFEGETPQAGNNPPSFSMEDPSNNTYEVSRDKTTVSVYIEDLDGDTFNWTVETTPNIGTDGLNNDHNGSKIISIAGLQYGVNYTWYVNATDGNYTTNESYKFQVENETEEEETSLGSDITVTINEEQFFLIFLFIIWIIITYLNFEDIKSNAPNKFNAIIHVIFTAPLFLYLINNGFINSLLYGWFFAFGILITTIYIIGLKYTMDFSKK